MNQPLPRLFDILARPRLTSRLIEATHYPATLVVASEGFGKSVAVRHFLEAQATTSVHVDLRPEDGNLVPFVRAFAEALSGIAPGLRHSFAGAIEYALQAAKPHEELALWFLKHISDVSAIIVIEDVHHTEGDTRISALLTRLLEQSPSSLRWIFVSRTEANLPVTEWRECGLLGEPVDENDLQLTKDEVRSLPGLTLLSDRQAEALFLMTNGWPLAFSLGMRLPEWIEQLDRLQPQSATGLYSFFAERIFANCDAPLQELLLGTCVFSSIDHELIAASPWRASWYAVQDLADDGLLLSRRGDGSLRFHDLFQQFLRSELQHRSQNAVRDAQVYGAKLLEACNRVSGALRLYVLADRPDDVIRLCEHYGFSLIDQGRIDVLRWSLSHVDDDQQQRSAAVLAIRAIEETQVGRTDTAEAWFLQAMNRPALVSIKAEIAYRYALDLIRHGRLDGISMLEPYASNPDVTTEVMASIRSTLATAYVLSGKFDDARNMMSSALEMVGSDAQSAMDAKIYHHVAWVALFAGDIETAKRYALQATGLAESLGLYELAARAHTVLFNVAYEIEDDPHAVLEILDKALDYALKAGSAPLRLFALLGIYDIAAESGDSETLERTERMLQSHEVSYSDANSNEALLPAQALRIAGLGEFARAYELLLPTCDTQVTVDRRTYRFSEISLYASAARLSTEANAAIEEVLRRLVGLDPASRRTIRTRLNVALALRLVGRVEEARCHLDEVSAHLTSASPRLISLAEAVLEILNRWDGSANHLESYAAIQQLRAHHFGGIGAVLTALPCSTSQMEVSL